MRWVWLLILTACASPPRTDPPKKTAPPPTVPLAVTIDDLPFVGPTRGGESVEDALGRIARVLAQRDVPTTGFVVCDRLEGEAAAFAKWTSAGLGVANHSTAHKDIDAMSPEDWIADVRGCRDRLATVTGTTPKYFRYPMLHTGRTRERRDAGFAALDSLGHVRAPVSIDTGEWVLARAYAKASDERAKEIGDAYVAHLRLAARHYRRVAVERTGREVAQVLLLHANALAADHLGRVLTTLEEEGFRFVSLDEALKDPVYEKRDDWVDPVGASWLLRIAPADIAGWGWDRGQTRALEHRFDLRDGEERTRIGRALEVRRLPDTNVWIVTQKTPVAANSLVFATADGTPILADTPWTPTATRELLDWVELRFGRPAALATISHWHFDAAGGIGALRDAGVPVVASSETKRLLATRGASMQAELVSSHGDDFVGWSPGEPDVVFDPTKGFEKTIGGTKIEVIFPGAAHASDNVVTWIEDAGVMFGGCLVKGGDSLGYLGDADLESYPKAVERLEALEPKIVIPGHGRRTDPEQLANTRKLLEGR